MVSSFSAPSGISGASNGFCEWWNRQVPERSRTNGDFRGSYVNAASSDGNGKKWDRGGKVLRWMMLRLFQSGFEGGKTDRVGGVPMATRQTWVAFWVSCKFKVPPKHLRHGRDDPFMLFIRKDLRRFRKHFNWRTLGSLLAFSKKSRSGEEDFYDTVFYGKYQQSNGWRRFSRNYGTSD